MPRLMAADLANDKFWVNKYLHDDAEQAYYEALAKGNMGMMKVSKDQSIKSSLAVEVAKAREIIKTSMQRADDISALAVNKKVEMCNISKEEVIHLNQVIKKLETSLQNLQNRVQALEKESTRGKTAASAPAPTPAASKPKPKADEDDVDLFASESEEEDDMAKELREKRLAEYAAKKSKKPALIAKSNIILDIKPWDDQTNMKEMEKAVRQVKMDGLVWGASKLVPLVYGVFKLQISCVVEDDKVSVDQLTETLEGIEEHVQSVDIAAFNKV